MRVGAGLDPDVILQKALRVPKILTNPFPEILATSR